MSTPSSPPESTHLSPVLFCTRLFLLLLLAITFWMSDCAGGLSVTRTIKEKSGAQAEKIKGERKLSREGKAAKAQAAQQLAQTDAMKPKSLDALEKALGGCRQPGVAAQVVGTLEDFCLVLPASADRAEFQLEQYRDFIFIGVYTLAFLGLAMLLRQRVKAHFPGRALANVAVLLALVAAACDVGEDLYILEALKNVHGEYGLEPPASYPAMTPAQVNDARAAVKAKRLFAYGKWTTYYALCAVLAFVFLRRKLGWGMIAGGLLFIGGVLGAVGSLLGFYLPVVKPAVIEWGFLCVAPGLFVGTIILLATKSPEALWEDAPEPLLADDTTPAEAAM